MSCRSILRFAVSVPVIAVIALSCSSNEKQSRPPDRLLVGAAAEYPPFDVPDSASGQMSGFDVELVSLIAQTNRWQHEFVALPFEDLFTALRRADIDMVASAVPVTREVPSDVAYSDPYYLVSRVLVLRSADSLITGLEDLPTGPVGAIAGTDLGNYARDVRNFRLYARNEMALAFSDVADGSLAALIADYPVAREALKTRTSLKMCLAPLGYEYYVFAMRSADTLRLRSVNDALATLVGGYSYEQLHQKCFGYPPLNLAVPDSVAERWPSE